MFIDYLIGIFVFLFGVCIGSFLNCLIYRLEEDKSIMGRSFCPHCKHLLSWQDLFPVLSFLFLKAKCRYCKAKISWQYPVVEILTAVIFLLIFNFQFSIFNEFSIFQFLNLAFLFYVSSALIIIFVYDLKHYLIPDVILFPAIVIALIFNFQFLIFNQFSIFIYSIIAAVIASGFFFLIWLVSGGKWMGFGDVKLAILLGLLLGMPNTLVALFLAFFFGAIIGIILMILKGKTLKSEIPFGPFLITGTFITMFYGNQIIQWYTNFFQI